MNNVSGLIYGGRDVLTEEALKSKFFTEMVKISIKNKLRKSLKKVKPKKELKMLWIFN